MIMKKLYKYIVFVFGILAFSACTDDVEFPNVVEEGNDVTLKLGFQHEISKEVINSRAEATTEEKKLFDLHFYVFNSNNELTGYEQIVSKSGDIITPGVQDVIIRAKTGTSYIYAVANINEGGTYYLDNDALSLLKVTSAPTLKYDAANNKYVPIAEGEEGYVDVAEAVASKNNLNLETFKGINYQRRFATQSENNSPNPSEKKIIMSGYINDGNPVTINKTGIQLSDGQDNIVRLYRVLAKNTFTVKSYNGEGKKGKFTPKYYRLCKVPKTGVLIPNANISETSQYLLKQTENGIVNNITEAEVESNYQWNFEGNETISFYYPENLQVVKAQSFNENGESLIDEWKDREKNTWNKTYNTKTFDYAADNAAYIEIYGDYVDNSGNITANVNYTIHFGDFSSTNLDENGARIFTDYNVIRNHEYIYEVTVNGVDDIKVEAQTTTSQDNPYAEGLIVNAEAGTHFLVDAHYEARVMAFTKSSYEDLEDHNMGYFLSISTPFAKTKEPVYVKSYVVEDEQGKDQTKYGVFKLGQTTPLIEDIYNINSGELNDVFNVLDNAVGADYTWLRFVRNTTNNLTKDDNDISLYTCKYPGDQWDKKTYDNPSNGTSKPAKPWLNVFELLAELYKEGTYTDDGEDPDELYAYYTCFVDENYYANKSWPDYVDKEQRTMLIANELDVSSDGKSIYAEVEYSISQRSITTFYTPTYIYPKGDNITDLVIAFGTEIVDEEDKFKSRISNNNHSSTGINIPTSVSDANWEARTIAVNSNVGENNWYAGNIKFVAKRQDDLTTKDVDETIEESIQPLYTNAGKACMSRNRDKDGDGHIDGDEVKWYLAAVDQYRALFFGQNKLKPDAYLFHAEDLAEINWAYTNRNNGSGWGSDRDNGHSYRRKYHYYTATNENNKSNGGDKAIFWPEEGLTNNPMDGGYSWAELVRCIRTLESGSAGNGNEKYGLRDPEPFYDYASNKFDLGGIVSTRNYTTGSLEEHNEVRNDGDPTKADNNLSASFVIASSDLDNPDYTFTYTNSYGQQRQNDDPKLFELSEIVEGEDVCAKLYEGDGSGKGTWRTPNQKEIALMVSKLGDYRYGTRTKFSGSQKAYNTTTLWHATSIGHWSDSGGGGRINVGTGYESGVRIRCVRDVIPTSNNGANTQ